MIKTNLKSLAFIAAFSLIPASSAVARVRFGFGVGLEPRPAIARVAAYRAVRPVRVRPVRHVVVARPVLRPMLPSLSLNFQLKRRKHKHRKHASKANKHKKSAKRRK